MISVHRGWDSVPSAISIDACRADVANLHPRCSPHKRLASFSRAPGMSARKTSVGPPGDTARSPDRPRVVLIGNCALASCRKPGVRQHRGQCRKLTTWKFHRPKTIQRIPRRKGRDSFRKTLDPTNLASYAALAHVHRAFRALTTAASACSSGESTPANRHAVARISRQISVHQDDAVGAGPTAVATTSRSAAAMFSRPRRSTMLKMMSCTAVRSSSSGTTG